MSAKVLIVPCSGIGKAYGLMAREAAYEAVRLAGPERARTLCLALLVPGDAEAVALVRESPCLTVDGCAKLCARKNVELAGGRVAAGVRVLDAFRSHRGADPGTPTHLNEIGWAISDEIAAGLAAEARRLGGEEA